jgi:pimeloyl-ACP methyl ester carboxylesterase
VTTCIGIQDPEHCAGIHLNMPIAPPDPATMNDLTDAEKSALAGMQHYQDWDSGYSKQQSTRPQTVGYGLTDSPAGQAAWILEKFWSWTDCDGHPENVISRDALLDNVMLYWLPATAASSARLYWESFRNPPMDPITIPVGCSIFPKEIFRTSKRWAEKRFEKLVYFETLAKGGHFAAFEQPETFVREVRECFRRVR